MKKILLVICYYLLFCSCGSKRDEINYMEVKKTIFQRWEKDYDFLYVAYEETDVEFESLVKPFFDKYRTSSDTTIRIEKTDIDNLISDLNETLLQAQSDKALIRKNGIPINDTTIVDNQQEIKNLIASIEKYRDDYKPPKGNEDNNLINGLLLILVISASIIYFMIYYPKRKDQQKEKNLKQNNSINEPIIDKTTDQDELNTLKKEILNLKKEITNYENEIRGLNDKNKILNQQLSKFSQISTPETNTTELPKPQEKLKQFYLSTPTPTPDGMGSFRDMRLNQPNPNSSFYLFELDKFDENKATFSFLDNPNTVQNAIAYPDTNLMPACNYKNFNSKAKHILTDSRYKGIAVKEGEIWKIIKKAEIRFE